MGRVLSFPRKGRTPTLDRSGGVLELVELSSSLWGLGYLKVPLQNRMMQAKISAARRAQCATHVIVHEKSQV